MLTGIFPSWLQLSIVGFFSNKANRCAAPDLALEYSGAKASVSPMAIAPYAIAVKTLSKDKTFTS